MDDGNRTGEIEWRDGAPVATRFGDPYHAVGAGIDESRHVFLRGNGLPERLRDGFHVAELGFGTGRNALVTLAAWRGPGRIRYTAFEAWPMGRDDMARALTAMPGLDARPLLDAWPAEHVALPGMNLRIVHGDARESLPRWEGRADAWYLDGFAPARNPEMWEPGLLAEVARRTAPGGTFATYTAAGHVRRALEAAGFAVERVAGFGRKRHMARGVLR